MKVFFLVGVVSVVSTTPPLTLLYLGLFDDIGLVWSHKTTISHFIEHIFLNPQNV